MPQSSRNKVHWVHDDPKGRLRAPCHRTGMETGMHEMALLRNVVDLTVAEATAAHAQRVTAVYLTIGEARDVIDSLVDSLFEFLSRGTIAEGAKLVVTKVPLRVRCNKCGEEFALDVSDESTWTCSSCHAYHDYRVVSGMEFKVSRIEVSGRADLPNVTQADKNPSFERLAG
jgi:hydrogenase nickel incorporation protein HypA/HybF